MTAVKCPSCRGKCSSNVQGVFKCNNPECDVHSFRLNKRTGKCFDIELGGTKKLKTSDFTNCETCPKRFDKEYCQSHCLKAKI